jgi:integrase
MKRLKYLYSNMDRHGNRRWYFQYPGGRRQRIRAAEGTKEFHQAYKDLLRLAETQQAAPTPAAVSPGSFEWLCRQYMASKAWSELAPNTKRQRANFLDRFNRHYGHLPYASLTPTDIAVTRDALPRFAGRNFVKTMRAVFRWASEPSVNLIADNPAQRVTLPSGKTQGHTRWELDHVMQFKRHFPKYHRARIALALLLFTSQRISDVRLMGRASVRENFIRATHRKTGNTIEIPILPLLKDELGERFREMIWWEKESGGPYSEKACSMRFSAYAKEAGLPDGYTAHGLRKCAPTILAELGLSEDTIMAVLGDESADEARIYIQGAKRKELAQRGLRAFEAHISAVWNTQ